MSAHDRWLANYSVETVTAYCDNRGCPNADGVDVTYAREYGQGWYEPEECWICNGGWLEDPPEEEDEDDE
jgi:hypothetical protein